MSIRIIPLPEYDAEPDSLREAFNLVERLATAKTLLDRAQLPATRQPLKSLREIRSAIHPLQNFTKI